MRKLLLIVLACCAILVALPRCASIGTISGGDKDTIPPVLLSSTPKMYQTGFTDKEIKLTFNEYILLKDPGKQFFVSPPLETKAFPTTKGKSVVVKFDKLLEGKTTYTVGFGNSVADNNEGNPINNLQLVFSTGSNLDTLAVEGFLIEAYSQTVPAGVKVMLYKEQDDSLPHLANPSFYGYAEKNGFFRVPNVPAGEYKLVAIADKNDNLRYDQNAELIGFASTPVKATIKQPIDTATKSSPTGKLPLIRLFTEEPVNLTMVEVTRPKADLVKFIFSKKNPELPKMVITGMEKDPFIVEPSQNNDTVLFWISNANLAKRDTIKALVTYLLTGEKRVLEYKTQALELTFEAPKEKRNNDEEFKKKPGFNPTITGVANGLVPAVGAELVFTSPPIITDVSKMTLSAKTETDSIPQPFTLDKRSAPRVLGLAVDWKENTTYYYKILPGAFVSAGGIENDTIVGTINIAKKEEFGTIILKATGVSMPVILQLLSDKGNLFREFPLKTSGTTTIEYIPEGNYKLRLIFDDNDNQQWDSGDLVNRIQPEMVKYYQPAGAKETFVIKKNWENEISIDLKEVLTN